MQNKLREIRRAKDVSQQQLAEAVKTSRQTIIGIEKGHTKRPSDELMIKIADYFKVAVDEIFTTPLVAHMSQEKQDNLLPTGTDS